MNKLSAGKKARKKKISIIRYLDTGIFPCTVFFSCGFTYDDIVKHLKKVKADDWYTGISQDKQLIDESNYIALFRAIENKEDGREVLLFYIILRDQFDFTDYEMCKLAHEVLHICQFMLPKILDMEREFEAVAYTHTYLMRRCLEELRKAYKTKK